MSNEALLSDRDRARYRALKESLAKGLNPYEHVSQSIHGEKPYRVSDKTRSTISTSFTDKALSHWKPSINRKRQQHNLPRSDISVTGIRCSLCGKDITFYASVPGLVKRKLVKPFTDTKLVNDELVLVNTIKVIRVTKRVRVCQLCKPGLHVVLDDERVD